MASLLASSVPGVKRTKSVLGSKRRAGSASKASSERWWTSGATGWTSWARAIEPRVERVTAVHAAAMRRDIAILEW